MPAQPLLYVVLEGVTPSRRTAQRIKIADDHRVNHHSTSVFKVGERGIEYANDLGICGRRQVCLCEHPDAGATQAIRPQRTGVVGYGPPSRSCGYGVVRILPHDRLENRRGVGDGPRHGTRDVSAQIERRDAGAARQSHRGAHTDKGQMRRRSADGVSGVGAQPNGAHARRDRRRRAAARPRGDTRKIVRIARIARKNGTHSLVRREREFGEIGLGEHDGTGVAQASHHERIVLRYQTFER